MITYGGGLARVRDADPGMVVRTAFRLIRAKRLPDSLRRRARYPRRAEMRRSDHFRSFRRGFEDDSEVIA